MQALLEHFITQSTLYSLIAVLLVAFLESLALVGLILPGTVLMAGLGALIGSGELNFWHAWLVGIIGCLMGDWISFWLGWRFKKPLHRWSFMKKNKSLLDKTEHALHQHSMFTILVGRFCRSDEAAGADGGRDAGSSRGEIYWAELDWLFAVAAVLFPAGHSGGSGNRYSFRYAERRFQMAAAGDGVAAVGRRLGYAGGCGAAAKRQSIV